MQISTDDVHEDWDFPSKEIPDIMDVKPSDWVDDDMIPDLTDVKPEGYDDIPEYVKDLSSHKPEAWNDEDDGPWETPDIPNPQFIVPWVQIPNPDFKGEWKPRQTPNLEFDPEAAVYFDMVFLVLEVWVVHSGTTFDNIFIGDRITEARKLADETWGITKVVEIPTKDEFESINKAQSDEEFEKLETHANERQVEDGKIEYLEQEEKCETGLDSDSANDASPGTEAEVENDEL